jgi:hypothetical protein
VDAGLRIWAKTRDPTYVYRDRVLKVQLFLHNPYQPYLKYTFLYGMDGLGNLHAQKTSTFGFHSSKIVAQLSLCTLLYSFFTPFFLFFFLSSFLYFFYALLLFSFSFYSLLVKFLILFLH